MIKKNNYQRFIYALHADVNAVRNKNKLYEFQFRACCVLTDFFDVQLCLNNCD